MILGDINTIIENLQKDLKNALSTLPPKQRAEFNRFDQKRKKILNSDISWQEKHDQLTKLSQEYGVERS